MYKNLFKKAFICLSFTTLVFSCEPKGSSPEGTQSNLFNKRIIQENLEVVAQGEYNYSSGKPAQKPNDQMPDFIKINVLTGKIVTNNDYHLGIRGVNFALKTGKVPTSESTLGKVFIRSANDAYPQIKGAVVKNNYRDLKIINFKIDSLERYALMSINRTPNSQELALFNYDIDRHVASIAPERVILLEITQKQGDEPKYIEVELIDYNQREEKINLKISEITPKS